MVQDHVGEARQRGLDVSEVVFEDSAHVSHAKRYPGRYWQEVMRFWRDVSESTTCNLHKL